LDGGGPNREDKSVSIRRNSRVLIRPFDAYQLARIGAILFGEVKITSPTEEDATMREEALAIADQPPIGK